VILNGALDRPTAETRIQRQGGPNPICHFPAPPRL
jgi:hypothetical protein